MSRHGSAQGSGRCKARSEAMLFSLTEFAFVLTFLCIAALGVVYAGYELSRAHALQLQEQLVTLETEVVFLQELLDEKQYGVVPCWRRPEQAVPPLIGSVQISGRESYEVQHRAGDLSHSTPQQLTQDVQRLFASDIRYAAEANCYLRIAVQNKTNSFSYYRQAADELRRSGLVVVNE